MHILIAGATGFIGSALVRELMQRGHSLRLAMRDVPRARSLWPDAEIVPADFAALTDSEAWRPLLEGIHAVVNAVGIIAPTPQDSFETVHVRSARAMFAAAAKAGVLRIVQISALGADDDAATAFHRSKHAADQALRGSGVHACSVQPSLVFGAGGASARLFLRLASLPVIALPAADARIQPVHIDDLCAAIAALLDAPHMPARLAAVGGRCVTLEEYLAILRRKLSLPRARVLALGNLSATRLARWGGRWGLPFNLDLLTMLRHGNCADAGAMRQLLGRSPRAPEQFLTPGEAGEFACSARTAAVTALLRITIAIVWIVSGAVSLGLWPVADSLTLLARCGLHGGLALAALYIAALMDVGLGLGTLLLPRRRWIYDLQLAVIVAYSVVIGIFLPEFLLHPFAPVVKNLPMLAAILALRGRARR